MGYIHCIDEEKVEIGKKMKEKKKEKKKSDDGEDADHVKEALAGMKGSERDVLSMVLCSGKDCWALEPWMSLVASVSQMEKIAMAAMFF